jgi:hypothetical protein
MKIGQIKEFLQSDKRFREQTDTQGRRFHFLKDGKQVAYISFKYIWGGYKIFFYNDRPNEADLRGPIESIEQLEKLINEKTLTETT